ncbi:hypothetical protein [Runella sp.]|uniref:hypothetical protein n=1 Tax=Runella sp. TaxID=1960881 RepID=UPI00301A3A25
MFFTYVPRSHQKVCLQHPLDRWAWYQVPEGKYRFQLYYKRLPKQNSFDLGSETALSVIHYPLIGLIISLFRE